MFHRNAYQLFLKTFMTDASHIDPEYREKEAPRYWQMLPDADKAKHRKRLNDMKQKYIKDYEKFLKVMCEPTLSIRLVQLSLSFQVLKCTWLLMNIIRRKLAI